MPTAAGQMSTAPPADPQWVACNGAFYYGYAPLPARPNNGPSTGTYRDYWRNVRGWARTRGIGGWMLGVPISAGYLVSLADDSSEAPIVGFTVISPPPGTK